MFGELDIRWKKYKVGINMNRDELIEDLGLIGKFVMIYLGIGIILVLLNQVVNYI